jgi:hypothetical protein
LARAILFCLCAAVTASASTDRIVTAVFSRVSNGYHRTSEADGKFKREYYALTQGHYYPGVGKDRSIDPVKFPQIAGLAAQFLATKNYYLAQDAKQAGLLLEISWGKSIPLNDGVYRANLAMNLSMLSQSLSSAAAGRFSGGSFSAAPQSFGESTEKEQALAQIVMFNDMRRQADEHNAKLLGYVDEINQRDNPSQFAGAGDAYHDLIDDIENERYYIIISAYDFAAAKAGEMKRLWVTRVSVQSQGNRFNEAAALMLAKASRYFGQDSGRLVREFDREGKVTLGELQVVGVVPQSQIDDRPAERK